VNTPCAAAAALLGIAFPAILPAQTEVESAPPAALEAHVEAPVEAQLEEPETVLVTGEQPGPGLWKVSKGGDHVMWILGTHGSLPKDMVWRSAKVEAIVAESQEVLYPGWINIGPDIGFFRAVTLLPSLISLGKNPNDATLKDLLPPQTYEKWLALKKRYLGDNDDIEKMRPPVASDELTEAAIRKSGVTNDTAIQSVVNKAAKKHKVRIRRLPTVTRKFEVKNPRRILKTASSMDLPDTECFTRNLDLLGPALEGMRARANAWATGDLEALRAHSKVAWVQNCTATAIHRFTMGAQADGTPLQDAVEGLKQQEDVAAAASREAEQNWLDAVEAALTRNRTTFAVLPMRHVLSADGYVGKLRELGYVVEEPQ